MSLSKLKFSVILLVLSKVESLLKVNILDWCFIKECFRNLCPKAGACGVSDIKDNVRKTLQWHTQTWTLKTNLWCWLNSIKLGTCKYIVLKIKMQTDRPVQTLIIKWFPFTLSLSLSLSVEYSNLLNLLVWKKLVTAYFLIVHGSFCKFQI